MSVVDKALRALARLLEGATSPVASLIVELVSKIMAANTSADRVRLAKRALAALGSEQASEKAIREGLKRTGRT